MSFWTSPLGHKITGNPEDAFIDDFSLIPEGTMALAKIKKFQVVEKEATAFREEDKYIEIIYKLIDGKFKNREVSQKIKAFKVFNGKPESITRALNMLKLVYDLCECKPAHNDEPTDKDLVVMVGKFLGIKIGLWQMTTADGKFLEGNFVREVHSSKGFVCETGTKLKDMPKSAPVESAFSRNENKKNEFDDLDDDIPFK